MLYDLTSTYFEGEAEFVKKAKRGYSRDHRPMRFQVLAPRLQAGGDRLGDQSGRIPLVLRSDGRKPQ